MQEKLREISLIKKNILHYIDYKGINKRKFYIETGMANGILSQKTGLSEDYLMRFLSTYPEVNPSWLITGKGPMLKNEDYSTKKIDDKIIVEENPEPYRDELLELRIKNEELEKRILLLEKIIQLLEK